MKNFADIPPQFATKEQAAVVVLPVPYDGTSTWVKGADKGPAALIEASCNMELFDIETESEVFRQGIFTAPDVTESSSPQKMMESVYQQVKHYLTAGKMVVTVGGEHSVSTGAIKAYTEKYGELTVLQLDAHTDLRPEYEGSIYNHACVMSRVKEWCPVVQVGIRSMDKDELQYVDNDRIFYAGHLQNNTEWMDKAIALMTENVYITFDLDVLDPSIMPSTGTPEPGGLLWYETLQFLKKVAQKKHIAGFDVVELCPNPTNKAPDFLAAKLVYKILTYSFSQ